MTDLQRRFVEEYLLDLNATQAARRAGYTGPVRQIGSENLSKPVIQDAISRAIQERSARTQMAADEVLQRLARLARATPGEYATWGPDGVTLRPSSELTADQAYCVAEVSEAKDGRLRFKLESRVAALELCGRHLGLFKDVHEVHFANGVPLSVEDVEEGKRRAEAYRQRRLAAVRDTNGHASSNGNGAADPRSP